MIKSYNSNAHEILSSMNVGQHGFICSYTGPTYAGGATGMQTEKSENRVRIPAVYFKESCEFIDCNPLIIQVKSMLRSVFSPSDSNATS